MEKPPSENPDKGIESIEKTAEMVAVPGRVRFGRRPVLVMKEGDKIIFEGKKFGQVIAVLEYIEKNGLPGLRIEKGSGLIDLATRRINEQRVEIHLVQRRKGELKVEPQILEPQNFAEGAREK